MPSIILKMNACRLFLLFAHNLYLNCYLNEECFVLFFLISFFFINWKNCRKCQHTKFLILYFSIVFDFKQQNVSNFKLFFFIIFVFFLIAGALSLQFSKLLINFLHFIWQFISILIIVNLPVNWNIDIPFIQR